MYNIVNMEGLNMKKDTKYDELKAQYPFNVNDVLLLRKCRAKKGCAKQKQQFVTAALHARNHIQHLIILNTARTPQQDQLLADSMKTVYETLNCLRQVVIA